MSTGQIIQTVLMGLVFLAWAGLMFRTLGVLRRRAERETGQGVAGPGAFVKQLGHWARAAGDRSERNTLAFLTFVLLVMIGTRVTLG
jgi:hypothetical protein